MQPLFTRQAMHDSGMGMARIVGNRCCEAVSRAIITGGISKRIVG
jgi:hypothetical protein